ncbi:MAG TPA: preprotein translocase subunit SecE, partial [Caulobacteraceae bacterium]|nr:preprotein translocase subunit SecE [Caulobacteraceae bacterium]
GRPQRPPKPALEPKTPAAAADAQSTPKKKRISPMQFYREVQAEARKITWTTRQETWITSVMVFIMVLLTAVFFVVIDWVLGFSMQHLFNLVS